MNTKSKKKLLLTGGGGAGVEALNRLWSDTYDVYVADAVIEAIPATVNSQRKVCIPLATADGFVSEMVSICKEKGIDIIVPTVDEELLSIPTITDQVRGLKALLPAPHFVETMLDKYTTAIAWSEAGLSAPTTWLGSEIEEAEFPCIIKPRRGRGSRGVMVIPDIEAARAYFVLHAINPQDTILQELLIGQEYTVLVAANSMGNLTAVVPVKVGEKRGVTLRAQTEENDAIVAAIKSFHENNITSGAYNVQLILCDDGQVRSFEINPRLSTTTCLVIAAGVDPVSIFESDIRSEHLLTFQQGLHLNRYWMNHIQ